DMWTNRVALEAGEQRSIRSFAVEHIEMVHPEIDEYFLELAIRIDCPIELLLNQLGIDKLLRLVGRHRFAARLGQVGECLKRECPKDLLAFVGIERIDQRELLLRSPAIGGAYLVWGQQLVE